MKNVTIKSAIAVTLLTITALLMRVNAGAQQTENSFNGYISQFDKESNDGNPFLTVPEKSVNLKAVRNFHKAFPEVKDAKWRELNGYYFVSFSENNVKLKIVYNRKGDTDYSMKMYGEEDLPEDVRAVVKSIYYDYKISTAQELNIGDKTIFVVQISDPHSWKTIRVSEGQLQEIETLRKY